MIQTLIKNWWLLALCGVLDLIIAAIYFNHAEHGVSSQGTLVLMGRLTLAAGACTIAAGLFRSQQGKSWLLVLNGLALGVLGLIFNGTFGFRIRFVTIVLLLFMTAMSTGLFELVIARALRHLRHVADEWVFAVAGALSVAFALAFLAMAFRWIKLEPGAHWDFLCFGSYFGFSAICMLGLALRLRSLGPSQYGAREALPVLTNPKPAR